MSDTLLTTSISSLPLVGRGKVRDNYSLGEDKLLMVATDRLSAFDVIMNQPIPRKGVLLTQMSLFWFEKLSKIIPNHLTGDNPEAVVSLSERSQVEGRSMIVKRLRPLPVEAVVRGYLAGSAWSEYQNTKSVCGINLPAGLLNATKLQSPIFTPAKKATIGNHDENISFDNLIALIGDPLALQVRNASLALYETAANIALKKGIIIADTKFEFGLDNNGLLTLMDEVLTPDSSRFWDSNKYSVGTNPPSYDKQFVRDWLENLKINSKFWDKRPPPPDLPDEVVFKTAALYNEVMRRLTS